MSATASHKKLMYRKQAEHIAKSLISRIEEYCIPGKCEVAGSVRRQCEKVRDIEIVCIAKYGQAVPFGELLPTQCNLVVNALQYDDQAMILKGGNRYHQVIFEDVQCDIFMTSKFQWGRMLALRTGPAEFSTKMASRWVEMGYKGYNGRLIHIDKEKHRYKPKFPTEESFFEFLGWDYIEPEKRQ